MPRCRRCLSDPPPPRRVHGGESMNERPTTYVQWRKLRWDTFLQFGEVCWYRARSNQPGYWAREYSRLLRRLDRLDARLHIEFEAMDATCCEEILKMVFGKGIRRTD